MQAQRFFVCCAGVAPFLAATFIIVIIAAVIAPANNFGALLFSFHPILMTFAFVCCMPFAINTYRLESLIAQNNNTATRSVSVLRRSHMTWQITAGVSTIAGVAIIIINKVIHAHPAWSTSLHATMGFVTVAGVLVQSSIGMLKVRAVERNGQKVHKWHGLFGLVVYSSGVVALCLGAAQALSPPFSILVIFSAVLVWLIVAITRVALPFPTDGETMDTTNLMDED
mmetsp:Transcript_39781/g.58543  ORF Transcript_39781/g.58543 Transcript_39781/m.58543 type:complete len:226 (+) Transcript_39781:20-697(+)